jgi:serine/threonine-protein kinase
MTTVVHPDLTATRFVLPADAKCLKVAELSARLRARIGPVDDDQSVITRPGARVTAKLVTATLAALIAEFHEPRLITDAVLQFSRSREQDPSTVLDVAFDAIARLIEGRILVPADSIDARASVPNLAAGQAFGAFEIDAVIRSLDDTEVYRARSLDSTPVALKIARDEAPAVAALLGHEAAILGRLHGTVTPKLLAHGVEQGRSFIAMEWCEGVSVATAAQQARAARDRGRLHRLVSGMFEAYGRLHAAGVLHGDIHPGNCLVTDNETVMLVDLGRAGLIDAGGEIDPARAGIPQFYDPAMAEALLAGRLPPACTEASEQYAVCVLAYLLLTGLHPIEASAVQEDLLQRVAERLPLPFAARGVAAWPAVERVLRRGLAREPADRFENMGELARSFAATASSAARGSLRSVPEPEAVIERTRSLARSMQPPLHRAWFALRAAMALEDAELLAAAAVLIEDAGMGWTARSVAARIAHARSDARSERQCFQHFLDSSPPADRRDTIAAILAAAEALEGAAFRDPIATRLGRWASEHLHRLMCT